MSYKMSTIATPEPSLEDARTDFERMSRTPSDLELEPITSEDEDYASAPPTYQIATYPADYTLEVLHQKWLNDEILIPDFQRRFVWKQVQASKLIESFLVGLPVPAVFLYSDRKTRKYFVIDGQQRLKSIFYFFEGYFGAAEKGIRKVFNLKGLDEESPFSDRKFDDLREEDQRQLKNAVLRAFIVQQLDPNDDTSMYHIFERLNTGGTLLANQEIRNCVYHGKFANFLDEINSLDNWRRILGKQEPDTRKKDTELILRFLAMQDTASYKKPMKDFLSKFMRKNQNAAEPALQSSGELFERTCESVVASLGEKPFHVRSGLNAAIFDAVMHAFSKQFDKIPTDIEVRYKSLTQDDEFDRNTRSGTTDVEVIRRRFEQAAARLFGK